MSDILWHDENEHLAVTLYTDASADLIDKSTGTRWRMGRVALQEDTEIDVGHVWLRTERTIPEQYPGRFQGERQGDALRFTLLGRERRAMGRFTCRFRLDGPWLEVIIDDIDESIPSLVFPTPIESESLVLPRNIGRWIREPLAGRYFWLYSTHLNMRWFGGLRGDRGWIAIWDAGYENAGVMASELLVAPGWLKSLERWTGPRKLRYGFTQGGYVGLAKAFRAYAIQHGIHRSLREKLDERPAARNLLGGRLLSFMQARPYRPERFEDRWQPVPEDAPLASDTLQVHVTHAQAAQIIREARELGMERGLVVLRGWIQGGYDETHPDVWPPEPALGTVDELGGLLALGDPLTVALHDNYQDIYQQSPSWPKGVNRLRNGDPMPGGLWAGGQAYILNSRDGFNYARRNWEQIKTLNPRAMFIDTVVAVQLYESYEAGNTLTRAQDLQNKLDMLRFFREQDQVLGSEEGTDYGIPWVDWIENRHHRVRGESIPLWPLVFHDAAFCARYSSGPMAATSTETPATRWLTDMLWGYMALWGIRRIQDWETGRAIFPSTLQVDDWHARVGLDDMLSHRYLTADKNVEETVFSSGAAIWVNYADQAHTIDGITVPAEGVVFRD